MAVTAFDSDTQTATVTTEHFVADVNAAGIYSFHVDTVNMADGDVLELRVYQMVLTGGTPHVAWAEIYYGAQLNDELVKVSIPVGNELTDSTALRFSLKQTFGTGRNYPWKVCKYA